MDESLQILLAADAWRDATPSARTRARAAVARALGSGFELDPGGERLSERATGLSYFVVPGGVLTMGLTDEDEQIALSTLPRELVVMALESVRARARPAHPVLVRPFLCTAPLSTEEVVRVSSGRFKRDNLAREQARQVAAAAGARLPSEAELEHLGRDGRGLTFCLDLARRWREARKDPAVLVSTLGAPGVFFGEWAEDDWHDDYTGGAPTTSEPWMGGDPMGVYRPGVTLAIQDEEELIESLAALRRPGLDDEGYVPDCLLRLVRPLDGVVIVGDVEA
jgi:hypothetical protein